MEGFERFLTDPDFDRLSDTVRWNGTSRIKDETVGQHSHQVAFFTRLLSEEIFSDERDKLSATTYAIFHDFDEMFSGDIINPVKYNEFNGPEIRELLDVFIFERIIQKFPSDSKIDRMMKTYMTKDVPEYIVKLVKVADWLSMYFYVNKEIKLGNSNVFSQRDFCVRGIRESCEICMVDLSESVFNVKLDILKEIQNMSYR